jgi:hypothetical protein
MKIVTLVITILAIMVSVAFSQTNTCILGWQNSVSTNVVGYNIYYGTNSGNYTSILHVGYVTTCTVSNLSNNINVIYYFAATAVDPNSQESGFSNEAIYNRKLVPPSNLHIN